MVECKTVMNLMKSYVVLHECEWDHKLLMMRRRKEAVLLKVSKDKMRGTMFTLQSVSQKGSR
eukprot:11220773-Prorocentrum_lima.AAC.1